MVFWWQGIYLCKSIYIICHLRRQARCPKFWVNHLLQLLSKLHAVIYQLFGKEKEEKNHFRFHAKSERFEKRKKQREQRDETGRKHLKLVLCSFSHSKTTHNKSSKVCHFPEETLLDNDKDHGNGWRMTNNGGERKGVFKKIPVFLLLIVM